MWYNIIQSQFISGPASGNAMLCSSFGFLWPWVMRFFLLILWRQVNCPLIRLLLWWLIRRKDKLKPKLLSDEIKTNDFSLLTLTHSYHLKSEVSHGLWLLLNVNEIPLLRAYKSTHNIVYVLTKVPTVRLRAYKSTPLCIYVLIKVTAFSSS